VNAVDVCDEFVEVMASYESDEFVELASAPGVGEETCWLVLSTDLMSDDVKADIIAEAAKHGLTATVEENSSKF